MSLYTFVNGQKKYIIKPILCTLTVSPTYASATVTFNTSGTVSGNTITVPKGTTVNYTVSADRHESRTLSEVVDTDKTVNPQLKLLQISPTINYGTGTMYQVTSWVDRGQCIQSGTYYYTRTSKTNTWTVTTNDRGEVTGYSTSGSIIATAAGTDMALNPTGGWTWKEVWE